MTGHVKYEESISAYKPEWQDEIRPYCDKKSFYTFNQPVNLIKISNITNQQAPGAWLLLLINTLPFRFRDHYKM